MKLAQIVPRVAQESSGPSHSVPALTSALAASGHDVTLHVLDPLPVRREFPHRVVSHPCPDLAVLARLGVSSSLRDALIAEAGDCAVMHTHSMWMMPNIYPEVACRGTECRFVLSPRGTLAPPALMRSRLRKAVVWGLGQRRAARGASLLHATSTDELHQIRRAGLKNPVLVVPNGVESPSDVIVSQARADQDSNRMTLLYLGRIHPHKQVRELLAIWSQLSSRHPRWHLEIAGPLDSPYARELQRDAESSGLQRCRFVGELTGEAKWAAYASADLLVLPSRSENFGMAIAESLASATPVVTTSGTPWRELPQRRAGWFCAPDSTAILATLDEALGESRSELAEMGDGARAWMLDEYSWAGVAERMCAGYAWLHGGDRPSDLQQVRTA